MVAGSIIEKNKFICGHEAGIIILVGIVISYLASHFGHEGHNDLGKMLTFDSNFFFYFCLPPIIFASGYNMKRRKFFENI
jgi:sodium/hydrogen exchanger-like protein 6/7